MPPTAIGPYEVLRELGRGGMGEVYLARDPRLDRQVAIKALPAHLAQDVDRLARFQREAKVLASLNHPGIGAIYGLEEVDGRQYLILEFVEGETLADGLLGGPIPVPEALALARQMAEALEAAHEKGVVHRDLKPANVMVTPEGAVKLLDFGLARTAEGAPSSTLLPVAADSPTLKAQSPSVPGAIMGTAGYMSPEQARGKPVDKRSDIFSFGCVLFEMVTGEGPFPGETVTDALGAILHREPDWSLIPRSAPARFRELLKSCLAKDRRSRLHDIGDARIELERTIAGQEWAPEAPATPERRGRLGLVVGVAAAAALGALGLGAWLGGQLAPEATKARPLHVSTAVPTDPAFGRLVGIAPDATFLVFSAWPTLPPESTEPGGVLMVRRLDRDETEVIRGTEGARVAALSPDGRWLAFASARDRTGERVSLKRIALVDGRASGVAQTLCDLAPEPELCWASNDEIAILEGWSSRILLIAAEGGEPRVVLSGARPERMEGWGEASPLVPGRSILASRWSIVGQRFTAQLEVIDLIAGTRTPVLPGVEAARYVADGLLIGVRNQNTIVAARFDAATMRPLGTPVTIWSAASFWDLEVSPAGVLAMVLGARDVSGRRLAWIDEQGQVQPIAGPARAYGEISMSPDSTRVAGQLEFRGEAEFPAEMWVQDLDRRTLTRIPTDGIVLRSVWSPDGSRIAYGGTTGDQAAIWERRSDGSGGAERLYASTLAQALTVPLTWSPDGSTLAFVEVDLASFVDEIRLLRRDESGTWVASTYLQARDTGGDLRFSPDGAWVLFASEQSGRSELYVQRFTGDGVRDAASGRVQVSVGGGVESFWWSPEGTEIRFINSDDQVLSVQVRTDGAFTASLPVVLSDIGHIKTRSRVFASDGRLLAVLQADNEQTSKVDLVVNYMEEVRARLDGAK